MTAIANSPPQRRIIFNVLTVIIARRNATNSTIINTLKLISDNTIDNMTTCVNQFGGVVQFGQSLNQSSFFNNLLSSFNSCLIPANILNMPTCLMVSP